MNNTYNISCVPFFLVNGLTHGICKIFSLAHLKTELPCPHQEGRHRSPANSIEATEKRASRAGLCGAQRHPTALSAGRQHQGEGHRDQQQPRKKRSEDSNSKNTFENTLHIGTVTYMSRLRFCGYRISTRM